MVHWLIESWLIKIHQCCMMLEFDQWRCNFKWDLIIPRSTYKKLVRTLSWVNTTENYFNASLHFASDVRGTGCWLISISACILVFHLMIGYIVPVQWSRKIVGSNKAYFCKVNLFLETPLHTCEVMGTTDGSWTRPNPFISDTWLKFNYHREMRTNSDITVLISYADVTRRNINRVVAVVCTHSTSLLYEVRAYRKREYNLFQLSNHWSIISLFVWC